MDYKEYVNQLDSQTVDKLKTAVELGKWESGERLTQAQIDSTMQAIMLWQATNEITSANEPFKVNANGEFSVGKGAKLKDTPIEYRTIDGKNDRPKMIFSTKDN